MRLLEELKRRNVFRMAGLYLVGAWLVTQVVSTVLPMFGAPEWLPRSVVILLAIGFVPTMIFSWVYELTPEGLKRDADVPLEQSIGKQTGRRIDFAIIAVLLVALGYFTVDKFVLAPRQAGAVVAAANANGDKSIAVLPFENLSADKENAYFADGIQDEILTGLAKVGDLKVISRTSTLRYDSKPPNLSEIGRALGVANILEGSVQRVANRVRINVQLIAAASDNHLWAETYDRTLDDVFAVQSEVAQRIAGSLKATLTRDEHAALAQKPSSNPAAYEAYLKARADIPRISAFERSDLDRSIAALQEAVRLDPAFALAWAQLVDLHVWYYFNGFDASAARLATAKAALDRAEALAPTLPEVRLMRAEYMYYGERDFAGALGVVREVRSSLPNESRAWYLGALLERRLGQWNAAIADFEHARSLSPNDFTITSEFSLTLLLMRRFSEALPIIEASLALRPADPDVIAFKAICLWNLDGTSGFERVLAGVDADSVIALALRAQDALYRRDATRAGELLRKAIAKSDGSELVQFYYSAYLPARIEWQLQLAELLPRDASEAAELYRGIRAAAEAALSKAANPYVEAAWRFVLARMRADHGERSEAVAEANRAMALVPKGDILEGPGWANYLARIYATVGDAGHAVPLLREQAGTSAVGATPAMLKLDPVWDPIRSDPGFGALVSAGTGSASQ